MFDAAPGPAAGTPATGLSDHFDGTRFFNPGVDTDKTLAQLLAWRRERRPAPWPRRLELGVHAARGPASTGEVVLTWIGQATVLIEIEGYTIITDPIFSDRASPLSFAGPRRVRDPGLSLDALPAIDLVLLSHNHYDHMDLPSLSAINDRWAPTLVTGLGNARYLRRLGLPKVVELDWWETCRPSAPVGVTYVPAQHWSSRTMFDRRRALWGGHVIETPAGTIYFAGDTAYTASFRSIAERYSPDVALLPIGAYEPRWFMANQHMNPEDAVNAHRDLGASLSLAIHWGTFQLTDEALEEPLRALEAALAAQDADLPAFLAPLPGEPVRWRRPL